MPRSHASDAEYILDGEFLLCMICARWMQPAPRADGTRAYWCGPPCRRRDLIAATLESRLELAALTRAITTLRPDLARRRFNGTPVPDSWTDVDGEPTEPDPDEVRRWEACDFSDRRALIRTGYLRAEFNSEGQVHMVRRSGPETR